ncbi:hypothetical protein LBMAG27_24020 [Bacteroidota bacterium]|nr:hypothetical protein LBMAG27_24020 [Bacteroidota bacterium]
MKNKSLIPNPSPKEKGTAAKILTSKIFFRKFILVVTIIFSVMECSAQTNTQDVIYLKDGSIYRGQISGTTTDGSIKLLTFGNNLVVLNKLQIDSMKQETVKGKNFSAMNIKSKGYFNVTNVGLLAGSNGAGALFETVNGYRFNHFLEVGGGTGIEYTNVVLLPVYLSVRSDLLKGKSTPFIHADCGYNFYVGSRNNYYYPYYGDLSLQKYIYRGGLNASAGVGIKINTRSDFAFMISWAYKFEHWSYDYDYLDNHTHYDYNYQRMVLKLGLEF